jgi:hypothetical protein
MVERNRAACHWHKPLESARHAIELAVSARRVLTVPPQMQNRREFPEHMYKERERPVERPPVGLYPRTQIGLPLQKLVARRSDPVCGFTSKANRKEAGLLFVCRQCQYTLHADLVGARNILLRALTIRQDWMATGQLSDAPDVTDHEDIRYTPRPVCRSAVESGHKLIPVQGSESLTPSSSRPMDACARAHDGRPSVSPFPLDLILGSPYDW